LTQGEFGKTLFYFSVAFPTALILRYDDREVNNDKKTTRERTRCMSMKTIPIFFI